MQVTITKIAIELVIRAEQVWGILHYIVGYAGNRQAVALHQSALQRGSVSDNADQSYRFAIRIFPVIDRDFHGNDKIAIKLSSYLKFRGLWQCKNQLLTDGLMLNSQRCIGLLCR